MTMSVPSPADDGYESSRGRRYGFGPGPLGGPHSSRPAVTTPSWGFGFLALAVVAVAALVLPWFRPELGGRTIPSAPAVHSWNGVIFFASPIFMLLAAVRTLQARQSLAMFRRASIYATVAGGLLLLSAGYGWINVPHNYQDWDQAQRQARSLGLTIGRGPQPGFWLAVAVGVAFVGLGLAGLRWSGQARRRRAAFYSPDQPVVAGLAAPLPPPFGPHAPAVFGPPPGGAGPSPAGARYAGSHRARLPEAAPAQPLPGSGAAPVS